MNPLAPWVSRPIGRENDGTVFRRQAIQDLQSRVKFEYTADP
jgi:hypothetical protein